MVHRVHVGQRDQARCRTPGDGGVPGPAHVVEHNVQQDGGQRAERNAAAEDDLRPMWEGIGTKGWAVTSMPSPMLVLTMTMLAWLLKSTLPSVWTPTTATAANIAKAAPPRTGRGMPRHDRRRLRQRSQDDHDHRRGGHHPAAFDLRQPHQATFSAKQV